MLDISYKRNHIASVLLFWLISASLFSSRFIYLSLNSSSYAHKTSIALKKEPNLCFLISLDDVAFSNVSPRCYLSVPCRQQGFRVSTVLFLSDSGSLFPSVPGVTRGCLPSMEWGVGEAFKRRAAPGEQTLKTCLIQEPLWVSTAL